MALCERRPSRARAAWALLVALASCAAVASFSTSPSAAPTTWADGGGSGGSSGSAKSGEESDAEDTFASVNSIIISTSLLALIAVGYLVNTHRIRHLPESGVAMVIGFAVGLFIRCFGFEHEEQVLEFRGELFFHVLLPPIIFEAGLSLETRMFTDNLGAICALAILGTIMSTWVVSVGLRWGAELGVLGFAKTPHLGLHCQLFGALISATDPVATIALFGSQRFRADPLLASLVNGEAVLNDAVALVLFNTLTHQGSQELRIVSVEVLGHFFWVSFGSVVVGLVAGAACSYCFRHAPALRRFPDYEISTMCLGAYLTFAFSQLIGLSGIVALFFFGVVLTHYNWHNLSEQSKVASKVTFGTLARIAESCVFLYLGVVAAFSIGRFHWSFRLVTFSLVLIIVARAAHVFPLSVLLNIGRRRKIDTDMSLMLWVSGMRGAICFALALRIPCSAGRRRGSEECRNSDLLVTTTISIVVLTTTIIGGFIEKVATALHAVEPVALAHIDTGDCLGDARSLLAQELALSVPLSSVDDGGGSFDGETSIYEALGPSYSFHEHRSAVYEAFHDLDRRVLQPMLGGPGKGTASSEVDSRGDGHSLELPNLHGGFARQPTLTQPTEEEAPTWSRSFVFE